MRNTVRTNIVRVSMIAAAAGAALGAASGLASADTDDMHWIVTTTCPADMHWSIDLGVCVKTDDMHW
ncbi:hypothetical protein [Actinophytocola sp.]|uniref:hypothetical protein n=1 Tax=Actinophytocola sp. TaxID=1872138 RepID=UPI00389AFDC4